MTLYVVRRMLQALVVVGAMTLLLFFGLNIVGNPIDLLIGPSCDTVCREAAIARYGLDQPVWQQYLTFLGNLLQGDLGRSYVYGVSAIDLILERMPATLELAFCAMLIAVVVGFPLGMIAGLHHDDALGRTIMGASILGFSVPTFWIAILFIMVFSVQLGLLPATGRGRPVDVLGVGLSILTVDGLRHMILPAVTLSLYQLSLIIRLTRAGTTEVMLTDYIRFARAKGLRTRRVIGLHATKNIMIPIITVVGLELGTLIAFAVVTETIFAWPGMGKLIIDSINSLDRPVIVAYLILIVFLFIVINLLVDLTYSVLDPRVRLDEAVP